MYRLYYDFTDLYDDPIAYFKQVAKEKTKEKQERQKAVTVELMPEALLPFDPDTDSYDCVKNIGHAAVVKLLAFDRILSWKPMM